MNQSIKVKLLGGFSVIVLLLIVVGLFMAHKLSETNRRLENLVDVSSKKINLSHELVIQVLEMGRHEKNIILEKDPVKKDYYKDRIYQPLAVIDKKANELYEIVDEKGKIMLDEFKIPWNSYKEDIDEIVLLAMKNEDEKAFKISIDRGLKVRDAAIAKLQQIVEKNEKNMANDKAASDQSYTSSLNLMILLIVAGLVISVVIAYWITQGVAKRISSIAFEAEKIASREYTNEKIEDKTNDELRPIVSSLININESFREVTGNANKVASGNFAVEITPKSEKDILGNALKKMTMSLRETTAENEKHIWLTTGQNRLNEKLRGDQNLEELASNTITFLSGYLKANIGAVYLLNEKENILALSGQYAFSHENGNRAREKFNPGEGLIGQVALEQKQLFLTDIEDDIRIVSSILDVKPRHLIITPFLFEGKTMGVIELGKLTAFTGTEKEFINSSMESIGISINSAMARKRIQELLEETQVQSEELQSQQEELKQMNEELEVQTLNLKQQQEELQMTNEELEEQTQALEMKNKEVESARTDIEQKTRQLEISSRYKSEFLANMSHELRTPLNSLLILSKDLSDNKPENLTEEQVECAEIIYKSGQDLLALINEVLDLSKIEAGKMALSIERVALKGLADDLYRSFRHHAEQKNLALNINLHEQLPEYIHTDSQRLNQILKNLLSNAVKFTEQGSVTVNIRKEGENKIAISVTDTGIGIPEGKQLAVFEAFQQVDGSTSRKYGGTGLGLSISRELARLLNGKITLTSKPNEGSTFTLIIPQETQDKSETVIIPATEDAALLKKASVKRDTFLNYPAIADDRKVIGENDKIVLVIEDDLKFAEVLLKQAHDKGFKCLAAGSGEEGLALAEKYMPHAIILDIELPGISGHKVLTELKSNPFLRHIPVHIMSVEERSLKPIKEGAVEYLTKPVNKKQLDEAFNRIKSFIDRKMKHLLIVEDDANSRKAIRMLIGNGDVKCFEAGTGKEALKIFEEKHIDCIVLDIGLPDISGFELIREFGKKNDNPIPPVIVYTGKELTKEEDAELQKYAEAIIVKGVKSEERLLDETALFLHRTISNLPESKQRMIVSLYDKDIVFKDKKILLADDDMRNVFALSKVLKEYGMEVIKAESGINALEMLDKHSDIDLVLMDIMMPEMDGYEAMRKIRLQSRFKHLPVIAVTAKAMKEDKQKCIDAGANDYISKPVEIERLLSLMRVWLSK